MVVPGWSSVVLEQLADTVEEFAAEQSAEGTHRKEELALLGRTPVLAIRTERAAADDAVKVGMKVELLTPGMEDCGDANIATQPAAAEFEECG